VVECSSFGKMVGCAYLVVQLGVAGFWGGRKRRQTAALIGVILRGLERDRKRSEVYRGLDKGHIGPRYDHMTVKCCKGTATKKWLLGGRYTSLCHHGW
jgi:hypothetical protein